MKRACNPPPGRHMVLRVFSLQLAILFAAANAFADSWKLLYRKNGIEVFSSTVSTSTFKAEGFLPVDVVDILAVFSDVPRRTEWVRSLAESRVVSDNHVDRVLVYNRYRLPWPAHDRDSLLETKYSKDYKGGTVNIQFTAVDAAGEPPRKDAIRLTKVEGRLHLKVLGKGKTFVRYEVNLDPGGWLPQWVCNYFVRDAPMEMLQAMKRRIEEKRFLRSEDREAQIPLWHGNSRD